MALVDCKQTSSENMWFLDYGRSNHMCGNKNMFSKLDSSVKESVKLGNNSRLMVHDKGKIRIEVNGVVLVITEVFFVPDLMNNLVSIGQLQEKGIVVFIQHGICKVFHPQKGLILETKMTNNRMFSLFAHCVPTEQQCFSSIITDQANLWHCRYGHLSWNSLKVLQRKNMVKGLPELAISQKVCEDCLVGKQHRTSFSNKSKWRASSILHSSTGARGPMRTNLPNIKQ